MKEKGRYDKLEMVNDLERKKREGVLWDNHSTKLKVYILVVVDCVCGRDRQMR